MALGEQMRKLQRLLLDLSLRWMVLGGSGWFQVVLKQNMEPAETTQNQPAVAGSRWFLISGWFWVVPCKRRSQLEPAGTTQEPPRTIQNQPLLADSRWFQAVPGGSGWFWLVLPFTGNPTTFHALMPLVSLCSHPLE